MKAEVTWLGEDALHGPDATGPKAITWLGIRFEKDKAVTTEVKYLIKKAQNNQFFKVNVLEEDKPGTPEAPPPRSDLDQPKSTSSVSPHQTTPKESTQASIKRPS